ncbi:unnamed protein product [Rotaria sp. Silwood2]|nr:unnamed protein product [Rotaria sp. Silwood2]CAF4414678.1 unnamed protein product [Rotaria sp. Silwood2]
MNANKPKKNLAVTSDDNGQGSSKRTKISDDDNADVDRKRTMQKFEGAIVTDPNVAFDDVVKNPEHDGPNELWLMCSPGDPAAQSLTLDKITPDELCEPPVIMSDMLTALATQKSTVDKNELGIY